MGNEERGIFIFNVTLLAFIATNFETNLGLIFLGFALANHLAFTADKAHTILIRKDGNSILKSMHI